MVLLWMKLSFSSVDNSAVNGFKLVIRERWLHIRKLGTYKSPTIKSSSDYLSNVIPSTRLPFTAQHCKCEGTEKWKSCEDKLSEFPQKVRKWRSLLRHFEIVWCIIKRSWYSTRNTFGFQTPCFLFDYGVSEMPSHVVKS